MNHNLVSIVIPCKNAEPFLKECLDSILAQTYTNWEVIFCNDHSEDNSLEIALKFAALDKRFVCLNNAGNGIIDALNTAYNRSKGNFITRMDADDIMPPQKLQVLTNLLNLQPDDCVATGKVKYFTKGTIQLGFKNYEHWLNQLINFDNHWEEIYKECVIPSPCWMMKRAVFEKIGAFKSTQYPEDYDLVWRMFLNQLRVVSSKEILHLWRDHALRASRNLEVYKSQTYFDLKIGYMMKTKQFNDTNIFLWGAGKKGKALAKILGSNNINFEWYSNNPKKIGFNIYEKIIQNTRHIPTSKIKPKILIAVSNASQLAEICSFLDDLGYKKSKNYFVMV